MGGKRYRMNEKGNNNFLQFTFCGNNKVLSIIMTLWPPRKPC